MVSESPSASESRTASSRTLASSSLPALNVTTYFAGTSISSPVFGFLAFPCQPFLDDEYAEVAKFDPLVHHDRIQDGIESPLDHLPGQFSGQSQIIGDLANNIPFGPGESSPLSIFAADSPLFDSWTTFSSTFSQTRSRSRSFRPRQADKSAIQKNYFNRT